MKNPIMANHVKVISEVANDCSYGLGHATKNVTVLLSNYIYNFDNEKIKFIDLMTFYALALYLSGSAYNYSANNHFSIYSSLMFSAGVHTLLCNPVRKNNTSQILTHYPKSTMLTGAICGVIADSVMSFALNKGASIAAIAVGNAIECPAPIKFCKVALGIITLAIITSGMNNVKGSVYNIVHK